MTVVLITGASRGLGAVAARRLVAQGVTVLGGVRRPDAALPDGVRPVVLDVTDDASVAAAVREVGESVGALDVLVNNAGIDGSTAGPEDIGPDDLRPVFETNVFGPVRVTRAFLPLLRRAERPRLVMVSSGLGSFAQETTDPFSKSLTFLPYPASKAALTMLAVQYAKALPDVLVTTVDPGYTATEFNGFSGPQTVEEGTDALVAAVLDTTGPTGRFLDRQGVVPW